MFDEEEYIKYLALRAKRLMGTVLVERKCKIMSEDTRSKVEGMLHASVKALEEKRTKQRLGILYSIAKFETENSEAWNCGEVTKSLLLTRLTDLRDFYLTHKLENSEVKN